MDDKPLMESILMVTKGVCDLYMHGTIESPTPNVHFAFDRALQETLSMQAEIYKQMSDRGWYPVEQADQQKIEKVKQKFAMQV